MADKVTAPADPLAGLAGLLQTLGGNRQVTTTNAGDTTALRQVLSQLQGQNYEQLLQGIFQQAAGGIPQMQAAFANATGARSGGNSAVQAALQSLLQQTTLAAQQQIAQQQAQNAATQVQAGNAIANATRGTMSRTNSGTNLGQAAQIIAGLQLFGKVKGLWEQGQEGQGPLGGIMKAIGGGANSPNAGPGVDMTKDGGISTRSLSDGSSFYQPIDGMAPGAWQGDVQLPEGFANFSDYFANLANNNADLTGADPLDALINVTGGFGTMPEFGGGGLMDDLQQYGVF